MQTFFKNVSYNVRPTLQTFTENKTKQKKTLTFIGSKREQDKTNSAKLTCKTYELRAEENIGTIGAIGAKFKMYEISWHA